MKDSIVISTTFGVVILVLLNTFLNTVHPYPQMIPVWQFFLLLLHPWGGNSSPSGSHLTKQHMVEYHCVLFTVWLCGWRGEGEPVACVVNSRYFQWSLTWSNLTLSLDPVWVMLDNVVYVCVCVYRENECDWIYPTEGRTVVLFCSSRETPDSNCTMLTSVLWLNTGIKYNHSIMQLPLEIQQAVTICGDTLKHPTRNSDWKKTL